MPNEMSELANQLTFAPVVAFLIDHLKALPWFRWLNTDSAKWVKVLAGFLGAAVTTVGITYSFDYDASNGGQFLVMIPSLHVLGTLVIQWVWQEIFYRKLVKG